MAQAVREAEGSTARRPHLPTCGDRSAERLRGRLAEEAMAWQEDEEDEGA